jgi:NAD(P)-dependent dehydrogenase (short-subunit alcohol dehydrogenase family)
MTKPLAGRAALIAGASQGLGREIAPTYVREGASVACCARATRHCSSDARRAGPLPVRASASSPRPCDVSKPDQVSALVDAAIATFPALDILVNSAGIYGPKGRSRRTTGRDGCRRSRSICSERCCCACARPTLEAPPLRQDRAALRRRRHSPDAAVVAYAAAKAAVVRFAETLAHELVPYRIDVNCIAPGVLNTRMLDEILAAGPDVVGQDFYDALEEAEGIGRPPLAKGVALAVYLASPASDGITGRLLSAVWDAWPDLARHTDGARRLGHLHAPPHRAQGSRWRTGRAMRVGIIGCGLVGKEARRGARRQRARRVRGHRSRTARALASRGKRVGDHRLARCRHRRARARPRGGLRRRTTQLAPITLAAIRAGKYVLVEKPAARSAAELAPVIAEADERGALVHVGFNHRHHRAFRKARELVDAAHWAAHVPAGALRARRASGYEREWRFDPRSRGGGS